MKEGFRQSMAWLHTWSALVVGWVGQARSIFVMHDGGEVPFVKIGWAPRDVSHGSVQGEMGRLLKEICE